MRIDCVKFEEETMKKVLVIVMSILVVMAAVIIVDMMMGGNIFRYLLSAITFGIIRQLPGFLRSSYIPI